VAFQGRDGRARAAYKLVGSGRAPVLVISPATERQLRAYDHTYLPGQQVERIIERKARTTFENALYTRQIIKENGFQSVILVTSWNHLPRSCLLLNILSLGSGTRIHPYGVTTGRLDRQNWYHHTVGWKMLYNEMVECWGSLIEWMTFRTRGGLSISQPGKSPIFSGLKKLLLFDVDQETFNRGAKIP
jgi:uncharacterized SAM-binding protein YcdF (DUF218 family)